MLALVAWLGVAQAGDPLTFEAVRLVQHGHDVPRVIFHAHDSGDLSASATCAGRTWRVARAVGPTSTVELRFDGIVAGTSTCAVHVAFRASDGSDAEQDLELEVTSLPALALSWGEGDHVVGSREVVVHATRPLAGMDVTLVGAKGRELGGAEVDLSDATAPRVRWDRADGEVVKVALEGRDEHGMWSRAELFPWYYAIPHEDVVFDSAQDVVRADQLPRLETAWADVVRVVDLYGTVVPMNLYVAGGTDTVGDAAYNQALSERRARAIARWFQARGFPGGVYYQGLGETHLAVATPDETDEARNRRALYALSAEPPGGDTAPRGGWRKL